MNGTNVPIHYFLYEKSRGGGKNKNTETKTKAKQKTTGEKLGFL